MSEKVWVVCPKCKRHVLVLPHATDELLDGTLVEYSILQRCPTGDGGIMRAAPVEQLTRGDNDATS